ncbi:MAG: glycosyltransferase, partial [Actinomycetota bacterium]|nr:glycosyltransferase [Actinomycetota bacterium]
MDLLFWHGYLLTDTGSNVFTREMVRALAALGHSVVLLSQDARAYEYVPSGVEVVRPKLEGFLPVFVVDRYPDIEARHVSDFTGDELAQYLDANVSAIV